jgi:hypothetical protein
MAYSLMGISSRPLDWAALNKLVIPLRRRIEVFPVPPDGLGLSVPQRNINETAWEEIVQVADAVGKAWGMKLYDLRTGVELGPDTMEKAKADFLSQETCDA